MQYINLETKEVISSHEYSQLSDTTLYVKYFDELLENSPLVSFEFTGEIEDRGDGAYVKSYNVINKFKDIFDKNGNLVKSREDQEEECLISLGLKSTESTKQPVPSKVEMRQARRILAREGLLASVNSLIEQLDEETQVEWEFASSVERNHALIALVKSNLGFTDEQIDMLFIQASKL